MKLYFAMSQIPELAGLTRLQRKLVYQCGLEACLAERPSLMWRGGFWLFGGLLAGAVAGWVAVTQTGLASSVGAKHPLLFAGACGLAGVLTGIFIGTQIFTAQLRPYLRRVLEERRDEIARIH